MNHRQKKKAFKKKYGVSQTVVVNSVLEFIAKFDFYDFGKRLGELINSMTKRIQEMPEEELIELTRKALEEWEKQESEVEK